MRQGGGRRPVALALDVSADRPFGLGRVDEADPNLLARRVADLGDRLRDLLGDLPLLLGGAPLVPLDGHDGHRTLRPRATPRAPARGDAWAARPRSGGQP